MMKKIHRFLVLFLFLLLFIEFFHPITAITQDLGRHIKTGDIIVHSFSIPSVNLFSYTYPRFPFINSHWLSEVFFYFLFSIMGFQGLLLLTTLLVVVSFGLLFFTARSFASFSALMLVSLLYFGILAERTDLRPEIFSFVFVTLFVCILYQYRAQYTRSIYVLPILELFWVNMHIYFPIGILLVCIFCLDELVSHPIHFSLLRQQIWTFQKTKRSVLSLLHFLYTGSLTRHTLTLLTVGICTALITLANPNLLKGALYPLFVFQNYGYMIQENQNIFFLIQYGPSTTIPFFICSVLLVVFCLFAMTKKGRLIDWLLIYIFSILGCLQIRNFVLFVFATFIPFTYALTYVLRSITGTWSETRRRQVKASVLILFFFFICWEGYAFIAQRGIGWEVPEGAKSAADFFIQQHIQGPIFNNFDIGSYLDYRMYPKEKVFVDGRPEAYPASFFQQTYIPMQKDMGLFLANQQQYKYNAIFFTYSDQTDWAAQFIRQIVNITQWHIVYLDHTIVILVRDIPENKQLIDRYGMNKNHMVITNLNHYSASELLHVAYFFYRTDWSEQEASIEQRILAIEPNSCSALSRLSSIYYLESNPVSSLYSEKYNQFCR